MISADVKANEKQQEIKKTDSQVAVSYNFL